MWGIKGVEEVKEERWGTKEKEENEWSEAQKEEAEVWNRRKGLV